MRFVYKLHKCRDPTQSLYQCSKKKTVKIFVLLQQKTYRKILFFYQILSKKRFIKII